MPETVASDRRPPNDRRRRLLTLTGALALVALVPQAGLFAQIGDGYFFHPPVGAVTLRGGLQMPAARSDFWTFSSDLLTVDRNRLSGVAVGGDLTGRINDRWSWQLGADWMSRAADSEYRRFEEQLANGTRAPIRQRTEFRRLPITFGWRYDFASEGTRIGQFAWMPRKVVPFVTFGGGGSFYELKQRGDFVNFNGGNAIFFDEYESSGWGLIGYAGAGVDVSLNLHFALTTQLRFTVGNGPLGSDFRGFQPLDLSGAMLTTGLRLRLP